MLLGAAVMRADAEDAARGPLGVVRALAQQLCSVFPHAAREAAEPCLPVLAPWLPELATPGTDTAAPAGRSELQRALHD